MAYMIVPKVIRDFTGKAPLTELRHLPEVVAYFRNNLLVRSMQDGDCLVWTGRKNEKGYGKFRVRTKNRQIDFKAHRISWELNFGEIIPGMEVCHKCDNRACIKPDHLFLGDHYDNMYDCMKKGRHVWVKLQEPQVLEIRNSDLSISHLRKKYNLAHSTIANIRKGRTWRKAGMESQTDGTFSK